jgi:hypothetical protein
MSSERIVLLLADKYGNPYAEEQCAKLLSVLPQHVRVMLLLGVMPLDTLRNIWYVYFKPGSVPCTVSRANRVSDIRRATAVLVREISSYQGILPTKDNLAPDDDEDMLAMAASIIGIVGILLILLEVLRMILIILLDALGITQYI